MPGKGETELGTAVIPVRADLSKLDGDLGQAKSKAEGGLGSILGKIGPALGIAAGAAAVAGLGVAAYKLGESFDDAYDKIRIGTGATGKALEGLQGDFKAVFSSVPASMDDVSTAIADLSTRTGQTGAGLQNLAKVELELSRITKTDLSANIAASTRMFGDWSIATGQQTATMDKLFRTSQATGIGVTELMQKVTQFGSPLRSMGFSLDESMAMLGKWEKEGVNSELVLGSLRIAAGKFARAQVPLKEGLSDTITQIKGMDDSSAALALGMSVFGARAGPDMVAAIREGRFEYADLVATIQGGQDTILGLGEETSDTAEKMQKAWNSIQVALEPVGSAIFGLVGNLMDALAPGIASVVAGIGPLTVKLGEWAGAAATVFGIDPSQYASGFDALFAGIKGGVGNASAALDEFLGGLAKLAGVDTEQYASGFEAFGVVLQGVANEAGKLWGVISDALAPVISDVSRRLQTFVAEVIPLIGPAIEGVKTMIANFVQVWQDNWWWIQDIVDGVWKTIQGIIEVVWAVIEGIIKIGLRVIAGDWEGAGNELKIMTSNIWNALMHIIDGLMQAIGGILQGAWEGIKTAAGAAWSAISKAIWTPIESVLHAIAQGFIDAINFVVDAVNRLIGAFNRIKLSIPRIELPGGGSFGGGEIGVPQVALIPRAGAGGLTLSVPAYAEGTDYVPATGLALLHRGEAVIRAGGLGASGGVTVNVNAPVYGVNQLQDVIVSAIDTAARRGRLGLGTT